MIQGPLMSDHLQRSENSFHVMNPVSRTKNLSFINQIRSYAMKEKFLLFLSTQQVLQSTHEESRTVYCLLQVPVDRYLAGTKQKKCRVALVTISL